MGLALLLPAGCAQHVERVVLLPPADGGSPIVITRDVTLVGRKEGLCDLVINRDSISKLQCLIVRTDGLLFVRDLASTNGTRVNGQRVSRGALLPGDELAFASVKFRVSIGPPRADAEHQEATELMMFPPGDHLESDSSGSDVRLLPDD